MSDLGDIDLDKHADESAAGSGRRGIWLAVALLVLLAGGLAFYLTRPAAEPEPVPQSSAAAPPVVESPVPEPAAAERSAVPPLPASDALARELIGALSSRPELATWLLTDGVIQSLAGMADRVARGQVPRRQLGIVAPTGPFQTLGPPGETRIDPASYARYDALADLVTSIDAAGAAEIYRRLHPLLDEAYADLGYPDGGFDPALAQAVAQILDVPIIEGDVRLVPKGAVFAYADDRLEAASPFQRQLLRIGPRNVRLIQAKVRAFADAAGLSE